MPASERYHADNVTGPRSSRRYPQTIQAERLAGNTWACPRNERAPKTTRTCRAQKNPNRRAWYRSLSEQCCDGWWHHRQSLHRLLFCSYCNTIGFLRSRDSRSTSAPNHDSFSNALLNEERKTLFSSCGSKDFSKLFVQATENLRTRMGSGRSFQGDFAATLKPKSETSA